MPETHTMEHFQPHINEVFVFPLQDRDDLEFTLMEVNSLPQHNMDRRPPFSLIFKGPQNPQLPQATYKFIHPKLGELILFLVPVAPTEGGLLYESLFN